LVPFSLVIARNFAPQQAAIEKLETDIAAIQQRIAGRGAASLPLATPGKMKETRERFFRLPRLPKYHRLALYPVISSSFRSFRVAFLIFRSK
jgi:hypothetical protein